VYSLKLERPHYCIAQGQCKEDSSVFPVVPAKPRQTTCGEYEGQPLYEWAVVTKRKESHQYNMTTVSDGIVYTTEFIGSIFLGPRKLAVIRQGLLCATLTRQGTNQYKCRVGPGIDPLLMLCFITCVDKIHECEKKTMEAKHYNTSYKLSTVL